MNETTSEKLLRQERDDAVLAHHLALAYIKTLEKENRILRQELAAFGSHTADAALARKREEDMNEKRLSERLRGLIRDKDVNEIAKLETRIEALEKWGDDALAYIKTLEAEVELQTQHSLTSWVLDAVLRLGWKPPALAAEEEPVCDCVPGYVCDLHAGSMKP
jgi:hypothetical protein